jgi:hypothetical protein
MVKNTRVWRHNHNHRNHQVLYKNTCENGFYSKQIAPINGERCAVQRRVKPAVLGFRNSKHPKTETTSQSFHCNPRGIGNFQRQG